MPTGHHLTRTRSTLHTLAEQLLAGHQLRVAGTIRLRVREGGFSTLAMPGQPELLAVDGAELVAEPGGIRIPIEGTFGELAAALGISFGMSEPPYQPATGMDPNQETFLDTDSRQLISSAWTAGDAALREFTSQLGATGTGEPVLWPEHLDVAITAGKINYGVSPGDGFSEQPYAYVGPFTLRTGEFWNAPFGAFRPLSELAGVAGIVAFFADGRERAEVDPTAG